MESEDKGMPHSLRAKIKGLRYKRIITEKDCDRLCNALDNEDVLDKIRAEITAIDINGQVDEHTMFIRTGEQVKQMVLKIIDKYMEESEPQERSDKCSKCEYRINPDYTRCKECGAESEDEE